MEDREDTTIADAGSEESSYGNYDFAFGASNEADYAPGPYSGSSGGGGNEADYAAGPYSGDGAVSSKQLGDYYTSGTPGTDPSAKYSWASGLKAAAAGASLSGGAGIRQGGFAGTGSLRTATGAATQSFGNVTTRKTILPEGQAWPTFQAPVWDEKAIRAKARKITAPLTTELGSKVQQVMSRYYENPNVRRTVLRDTLAGYGIGLGRALAQGEAAARSEYGQEYSREYNEAMANYNILKEKLLAQAEQVTTTSPITSKQQLNELVGTSKGNNTPGKVQYTLSGRSYTIS